VPERDLCLTRLALDTEKHVVHIVIDGSDSHAKTRSRITAQGCADQRVLPGRTISTARPSEAQLPRRAGAGGREVIRFTRSIENFSQVTGKGNTLVPLRGDGESGA